MGVRRSEDRPYLGFAWPLPLGRAPIPGPLGGGFSWLTGFAPDV